jgi:microcystin degradation protein MlrC
VPARIGIAAVEHRSNTFVSGRTTLDDFRAEGLAIGSSAVAEQHATSASAVGGALAACVAIGCEPVPLLAARALPGPVVEARARAHLHDRLLAALDGAGPLDGVVLVLSGAMVAEDGEDPEGQLLGAVREAVGSLPVAVVLDLRANPGAGLVEEADIVIASATYPCSDAAERGAEAVGLLLATIEGTLAPLASGRRLPLLTCPLGQATDEEPMAGLLAHARRLAARPGVAAASVLPGFPYADVERLGAAVVVTGEAAVASEVADELAAAVWERRTEFERELVPLEEAVARAFERPGLVVLVEAADSIGGGAPGNGTHTLRALRESGVRGAVGLLVDADAVAAASGGGEVELELGDPPLPLAGRVRATGSDGAWAVVDADGLEVVLAARRTTPVPLERFLELGIDLAQRRAVVVKSAVGWRATLAEIASEAVYVDTPGPCTCRLETLPYTRARRPVAPLDDM